MYVNIKKGGKAREFVDIIEAKGRNLFEDITYKTEKSALLHVQEMMLDWIEHLIKGSI